MTEKELRTFVVEKFDGKRVEWLQILSSVESFAVGILIECKVVLTEIDSVKKVFNIIVDEIDDRTNTGVFDPIDGIMLKGIFEKFVNTPKIEQKFLEWRNRAIEIIEKERNVNVQ
jgi:hypothetical protein